MGDQEKKNDEETKEDKVQDENEKVDEGAAEGKEKGESVSDDQQELQRLEEEKLRIEGEGEQEREEAARLSEERRNLDKIASEANKTTEELATSYARKEQARKELIEERSKRDLEVKELSQQIETIKEIKGDDDPTLKNLEAKLKGLEEESKLDDVLEKDMVEQKTKLEELMKQHAASLAEIEAKRKAIEGEFETLALQRKKRGDEEKKILARIAELKGEAPPDEGQEAELKGEAPPGEGQEAELKGEAPPGEGQEAELKGEAPPDEGQEAELKGEATPGEGQEAELKGEAPPGESQEAELKGEAPPDEVHETELKGEAPPREDQEAELEGEVPPGDVTKAELKAPSDESRGEQRGEVSFPLNDSAVFQLRETREKVLMAAKAIEILKEEFNKFQQKDHFTEEDMKNLPLQQNELMFRLAEFDVITKRVQHLMGLGETRAFELGPPRKFKFSLDIGEKPSARGNSQLLHPEDLPQVVVCGRDEQYPQLVVCGSRNYSDFQERIRRSESFHNGATVQGEMLNMPSDTQWPNNYQAADVFNPMGQGGGIAMGSPYYGTGMMGPFGQGNTAMPLEPWMIASGFGYTIRSMQGVQSTMVMPQRMMHSGHLQSASVGSFIPCPCICPKKKKKKKNKKAVPHQAYSCPCVATYSWKY